MQIRVGSRKSELAIAQTKEVINLLKKQYPKVDFEIVTMQTTGDKHIQADLQKIGGKGVFVKELEKALLQNQVDIVVHSLKDMPSVLHEGLQIGAVPKRAMPNDAFISTRYRSLEELPPQAVIGTSSTRRASQFKQGFPMCQIEPIRGNIISRIEKMERQNFDGIILAMAGLERLQIQQFFQQELFITELPLERYVPAIGQGALAVECRTENHVMLEMLQVINDEQTAKEVALERMFLHQMDGNCSIPIAGLAKIDMESQQFTFRTMYKTNEKLSYFTIKGMNPKELVDQAVAFFKDR